MTGNHIHPVANLQSANQCQDFIGRQIKRMQCQAKVRVFHQREKIDKHCPEPTVNTTAPVPLTTRASTKVSREPNRFD